MAAHEELQETHHGEELKAGTLLAPADRQKISRHVGRHAAPQRAVRSGEDTMDADDQDAVEDEHLIAPPA
eukprot:4841588-Pyramimonas_sp.AAC.1